MTFVCIKLFYWNFPVVYTFTIRSIVGEFDYYTVQKFMRLTYTQKLTHQLNVDRLKLILITILNPYEIFFSITLFCENLSF